MFLVLHESHDMAAIWATQRLRARGHVVEAADGHELAGVRRWHHRLGRAGAEFEIVLASGRVLASRAICGVFNRLSFLPAAWLQRIGGADRDYAVQEMHALYLSWLNAIPGRIVNAPTPQGLCGNWRHHSVWTVLAHRAGLPVARYTQSQDDDPAFRWTANGTATQHVLVVRDKVVAPLGCPEALDGPCRRLAGLAGCHLLGIGFDEAAPGAWRFHSATTMPDLVVGGELAVDALAHAIGLEAAA
jgi:hypothetical protein